MDHVSSSTTCRDVSNNVGNNETRARVYEMRKNNGPTTSVDILNNFSDDGDDGPRSTKKATRKASKLKHFCYYCETDLKLCNIC